VINGIVKEEITEGIIMQENVAVSFSEGHNVEVGCVYLKVTPCSY
jgi:hypothetical protein